MSCSCRRRSRRPARTRIHPAPGNRLDRAREACRSFSRDLSSRLRARSSFFFLRRYFLDGSDQLVDVESAAPGFDQGTLRDSTGEVVPFARIPFCNRGDERPLPPLYVDHFLTLQLLIGLRHCPGIDGELGREVAHRRERILVFQLSDHDGAPYLIHYPVSY